MLATRTGRVFGRFLLILLVLILVRPTLADSERIKVLFLGDQGHHQPSERAEDLLGALAEAGIDLAYTEDLNDLNPDNLDRFEALLIYANHETIRPEQESALIDYVDRGHGLVVLHCGSACFRNSERYVALVGGQFEHHGGEVFQPVIDRPDHPALKGVEPVRAWDETYVHGRLSDDRLVLMHREAEGGRQEPWTWVRNQGKGRVYYTASGHDERVFRLPAYQKQVIQAIRWASGRLDQDFELPAIEYVDSGAAIPNYVDSDKWGTQGEPFKRMPKPLAPEDSRKHLSVPGGFRVELFAAEPEVVKPICLSWDDRGRLWVAESLDYPNDKQPEGRGNDRIRILEDTDGDGRADKFTTFAEGLSIPTSMVHVPGGLIVAQAPDILFLADTDGDDQADERRVLIRGFATDDTHAGPSNLRLGFDGWIYATVGYAGFRGEVGGQRHDFRQALFRFLPDGSKLEVLTSTSNNTWGLGISETNEIVYSTANNEHSAYLALPNRVFESVRGWLGRGNATMADHDRIRPITTIRQVDWFGGFTAASGHAIYTARQFPESFWNRAAFVCEPTGHLVHHCQIDRQGGRLVSHDQFNLLVSSDEWTSPIVAEVGPDGTVWVIDWYNYIVQHNPTPLGFKTGRGNAYETPLRDKIHGRIYRVVNTLRPLGQSFDLSNATPEQLIEALKSDNMLWRMKAQWELVARGQVDESATRKLVALAADQSVDATGENPTAIHALWALSLLKKAGSKGLAVDKAGLDWRQLVNSGLGHPSAGVRRAALAQIDRSREAAEAIVELGLLDDPDPVVRREALLALSECEPSEVVGGAVFGMFAKPENTNDRWLPLAATAAGARHDIGFLTAALQAEDVPGAALRATRIVAEHLARGAVDTEALASMLSLFPDARPDVVGSVLAGLNAGWPGDRPIQLDEGTRRRLIASMEGLDDEGQLSLATLADRWGFQEQFADVLKALRQRLGSEVADPDRSESDRITSASKLARMRPETDDLALILDQVNARVSPAFASGLLRAVGQASNPEVGPLVVGLWDQLTPALRHQAVELLQQRPSWTNALLDGIENGPLSASDLAVDQAERLSNHPDSAIAERARKLLERGGRMPSPDREQVIATLLPVTEKTGDIARGRVVFEENCAKCHVHGQLGHAIGPDLTGFNVHPKTKILTEIIDPNRSVEGNYRQYTVATSDGQVLTGLLASETRTAIELIDGEANKHVVLRDEIDEMIASPKSLMPEGFEKQITPEEFADLLEFMTAKGRFAPLPMNEVATIVSTRGMFTSRENPAERLIFDDWSPKVVEGVPFVLIDPQGDRVPNVVLLHGPNGAIPPRMPKSVSLPCHASARAIHLLSGVSGWGYPFGEQGSVSLIVRLHYEDGQVEDIPLHNGIEFADYIRRVDVPGSDLAFLLHGRQIRFLTVHPKREEPIATVELVKGDDQTSPIVMAVTIETASD